MAQGVHSHWFLCGRTHSGIHRALGCVGARVDLGRYAARLMGLDGIEAALPGAICLLTAFASRRRAWELAAQPLHRAGARAPRIRLGIDARSLLALGRRRTPRLGAVLRYGRLHTVAVRMAGVLLARGALRSLKGLEKLQRLAKFGA